LAVSFCRRYTASKAEDLDPPTRLGRVLAKLQRQIDASGGRAIIALQEVSMKWVGPLDLWFTQRGYKFVASLYGNNRNDYMGVGMAYPVAAYTLMETDVSCPATAQRWKRKPKPPWPSVSEKRAQVTPPKTVIPPIF
jgi:hypothetical protein